MDFKLLLELLLSITLGFFTSILSSAAEFTALHIKNELLSFRLWNWRGRHFVCDFIAEYFVSDYTIFGRIAFSPDLVFNLIFSLKVYSCWRLLCALNRFFRPYDYRCICSFFILRLLEILAVLIELLFCILRLLFLYRFGPFACRSLSFRFDRWLFGFCFLIWLVNRRL